MRSKSAQAVAILGNPNHGATASVTLYASNGVSTTTVDEWLLGVEVTEDLDSPTTASLRFQRQVGLRTLSPLGPHVSFNPFSGEAIVAVGRRIKVNVSIAPDALSVSGLSLELFDGFIDAVEWSSEELALTCADRRAKLRDTWIERERVYGFAQGANATRGCYIWKNDLLFSFAVNDLVIPSEAKRNGHYYKVTAASSAQGTTEPTWPTGGGATVVSGGVTFTEAGATSATTGTAVQTIMQQIIDDNGLASIATLQVPVSPAWSVRPYIQERVAVWDAIAKLADQLGWTLRFQWSSGLGRFELTLAEPARSSTTAQRSFALADELELSEAAVDVFSIRNVVQLTYGESASRTPSGQVPRKLVVVTDAASVSKYGRRFMEVQEADTSQIDTSTEANRMANAMLSDLAEPTATVSYLCAIDPFLEVNDLVELPADGQRWSVAQKLAIDGITHSIVPGEQATTSLSLRGKPASRRSGWFQFDVRANYADSHRISLLNGSDFTLAARDVVGGTELGITQTLVKDALARQYEVHVGDTADFTPSDSTVKASGALTQVVIPSLVPGRDYFAKVIPYTPNGERIVRAEPSAALAFTAARANAAHLAIDVEWGRAPLNGGFETWNQTGDLPDHWEMDDGTWGNDFTRGSGDGAASGNQYLVNSTDAFSPDSLRTKGLMTVTAGRVYFVEWLVKIVSSTSHSQQALVVEWYGHSGTWLSDSQVDEIAGNSFATGAWNRRGGLVTAPSTARFAKLRIGTTAGGDSVFHIDSVRFVDATALVTSSLGIGTASPSCKLEVVDSLTSYTSPFVRLNNSSATGQIPVEFQINGTLRGKVRADYAGNMSFVSNGGVHSFYTGGDVGTGTERLRIDTAGLVTIYGTASIGQEAWTAPTFNSGWANYGGGFQGVAYFKDANGVVHLRGLAQRTSGSNGTLFTLPSGYRPNATIILPARIDGTWGADEIRIDSSGNVFLLYNAAGNHDVGFWACDFDTRA